MRDESDPWEKNMLQLHKEHFLEGLRNVPKRRFDDNPKLRKLCEDYRDKLRNCYDMVDYDLEHFSIHASMNYNNFIYRVLGGQ